MLTKTLFNILHVCLRRYRLHCEQCFISLKSSSAVLWIDIYQNNCQKTWVMIELNRVASIRVCLAVYWQILMATDVGSYYNLLPVTSSIPLIWKSSSCQSLNKAHSVYFNDFYNGVRALPFSLGGMKTTFSSLEWRSVAEKPQEWHKRSGWLETAPSFLHAAEKGAGLIKQKVSTLIRELSLSRSATRAEHKEFDYCPSFVNVSSPSKNRVGTQLSTRKNIFVTLQFFIYKSAHTHQNGDRLLNEL